MAVPSLGKNLNRPLPWIIALMTGGVLAVGVLTYQLSQTPIEQSELEKLTVVATKESLPIDIEASGVVEPIQRVNISPKNPGRLVKLLVEQGMPVKQGQTLAVMENTEIQAQGLQAQARFKEALANLEAAEVRIPGEIQQAQMRFEQAKANLQMNEQQLQQAKERIPREIDQLKAQVEAAKSRLGLAQARLQRNQKLLQEGAIAQDAYDEAWNEYLNAAANFGEAQQRLAQAANTSSPEIQQLQQGIIAQQAEVGEAKIAYEQRKQSASAEIAQLQAAAQAARAALEQVKIQFQDTVITAPFDGVITQKYASEGAFVTPTTSASDTASATSSSILALARGLEVIAKVPEVDIGMLQRGQPVRVKADAFPNESFEGRVLRIAPEAIVDQNVTSFEVTVGLVSGQKKLRPKMNVDVNFLGLQLSEALVVPTVAIVTQKGETGVMVPDEEQQPQFKPVTIGLVLNDKTEIISGLTPGERVFIDLPKESKPQEDKS